MIAPFATFDIQKQIETQETSWRDLLSDLEKIIMGKEYPYS